MLAFLGKRDYPTDGVEDYCRNLSNALAQKGCELKVERVGWAEMGWAVALWRLWRQSRGSAGRWALVQYAALAWSRHGFSSGFLAVLGVLRARRVRLAVVFHDWRPYEGTRLVDRVKRVCQKLVMRYAYRWSQAAILTVPLEQVSWLPPEASKAAFIPIGANIPPAFCGSGDPPVERHGQDGHATSRRGHGSKTIAVFTITDGGDISKEVSDIVLTARKAAERVTRIRLVTFGRGSAEAEPQFRRALEGSTVEFSALGILPPEEVSEVLANADVSLFVRGRVSTQRGTAIASIASGVPLVAYADPFLPNPLAESGIVPVVYLNSKQLADATSRVLTDDQLWRELRDRSWLAHEKYFSWKAIAGRFLEVLHYA
jgi:glycosyltransferase involved in cell wall biosynthesis